MSRKYVDRDGKIPLHTLRADAYYRFTEAETAYGHIGVEVQLCPGDISPGAPAPDARPEPPAAPADRPRK